MHSYYSQTIQGGREYQEDRFINCSLTPSIDFSAIFDGHGGDFISEFCKNNFNTILYQDIVNNGQYDLSTSLKQSFETCDKIIERLNVPHVGCTASVFIVTRDRIFFGNCGDSMTFVAFKDGSKHMMSQEHKVDNEKDRILALGGEISYNSGCARLFGNLNLGRSLGDFTYKRWIISTPFIKTVKKSVVRYIFNASDGIWDVMTMFEISKMLNNVSKKNADELLRAVIDEAYRRGSRDNITATICFPTDFIDAQRLI